MTLKVHTDGSEVTGNWGLVVETGYQLTIQDFTGTRPINVNIERQQDN